MKSRLLFMIVIAISFFLIGCNKDKNNNSDTDADSTAVTTISPFITPSITQKSTDLPTPLPTILPTTIPTTTPNPTLTPVPTPSPTPAPVDLPNSMTKENFPVVDGSTATIPLSEAIYQLATGATAEEAASAIVHTKTSQSYYKLMDGTADILIVYEPSDEVKEYMKSNGYNLQIKPIGKDALVFMANTANPVESLTTEQLVQIYSGKISNWSEVGGEDIELLAFQRPVNTGSQTLMLKHVMKDVPMVTGPEVQIYTEMEGILAAMADYSNEANTLGYSVFYYAKNMYHLPELRFMKVNGVEPSSQTIYDNSYPYINEFYAVIRENEPYDSNAHKIFDWLTQKEGQELVQNTGYVPVSLPPSEEVNEDNVVTDKIPDGYSYLMKSDIVTQVGVQLSTITVYEDHWQIKRIFKNVSNINKVGLISNDSCVCIKMAMHEAEKESFFKYGLYHLATDSFILQPSYEVIYAIDDSENYFYAKNEDSYRVVDRKGNVKLSDTVIGYDTYERTNGEYYWFYYNNYTPEAYILIYNEKFKRTKKILIDQYDNTVYTDDGTILFSQAIFMKHFKYTEKQNESFFISDYSDKLIIVYYENYYWVLDYQLNPIAKYKLEGEIYDTYFEVFDDIYREVSTLNQQREATYYNSNGDKTAGYDNNPYNNVWCYYQIADNKPVEMGYMYFLEENEMSILNSETGELSSIAIENADNYRLEFVCGDYVILQPNSDYDKLTKIYYKGQLLYELKGWYYVNQFQCEDGLLLYTVSEDYRSRYYRKFGKEGKTLYQSYYSEVINAIDDKYIQLTRGNYTGVIDYSGNFIIKTISEELSND